MTRPLRAERGHRHVALIDSHRTSIFTDWEEGLLEALQATDRPVAHVTEPPADGLAIRVML